MFFGVHAPVCTPFGLFLVVAMWICDSCGLVDADCLRPNIGKRQNRPYSYWDSFGTQICPKTTRQPFLPTTPRQTERLIWWGETGCQACDQSNGELRKAACSNFSQSLLQVQEAASLRRQRPTFTGTHLLVSKLQWAPPLESHQEKNQGREIVGRKIN